jgi:hypothetical protein
MLLALKGLDSKLANPVAFDIQAGVMLVDRVVEPVWVFLPFGDLLSQRWKVLHFAMDSEPLTRLGIFKFSYPEWHVGIPCSEIAGF